MPEYKRFNVQQQEDVTVVQLAEANPTEQLVANEFRDELIQLVETEKPRKLLVNFGSAERYPTAAISGLLGVKTRLAAKGQLKFCATPYSDLYRACRFLKLEGNVFDIYNSSSEAMASFC